MRGMTKEQGTKQAATLAKKDASACGKDRTEGSRRDSLLALSKLAEVVDGRYRIVSQPPVVIPARDLEAMYGYSATQFEDMIHHQFRATGRPSRRTAGTSSSGSRSSTWPARWWAWVVSEPGRSSCCSKDVTSTTPCSFRSRRRRPRCYEDHLPKSRFKQHGERVVQGQRICRRPATSTWVDQG